MNHVMLSYTSFKDIIILSNSYLMGKELTISACDMGRY